MPSTSFTITLALITGGAALLGALIGGLINLTGVMLERRTTERQWLADKRWEAYQRVEVNMQRWPLVSGKKLGEAREPGLELVHSLMGAHGLASDDCAKHMTRLMRAVLEELEAILDDTADKLEQPSEARSAAALKVRELSADCSLAMHDDLPAARYRKRRL